MTSEPRSTDDGVHDPGDHLRAKIRKAINQCSAENGSNTPDFILADYLVNCLLAFDSAVNSRERWYSRQPGWRRELQPTDTSWPKPSPADMENLTPPTS